MCAGRVGAGWLAGWLAGTQEREGWWCVSISNRVAVSMQTSAALSILGPVVVAVAVGMRLVVVAVGMRSAAAVAEVHSVNPLKTYNRALDNQLLPAGLARTPVLV